jgi:hypothetical protein
MITIASLEYHFQALPSFAGKGCQTPVPSRDVNSIPLPATIQVKPFLSGCHDRRVGLVDRLDGALRQSESACLLFFKKVFSPGTHPICISGPKSPVHHAKKSHYASLWHAPCTASSTCHFLDIKWSSVMWATPSALWSRARRCPTP